MNGITGILNEDIIDLQDETNKGIEGLIRACGRVGHLPLQNRFQKEAGAGREGHGPVVPGFQAHNIRYFFYAGGNDSQDTAHKIHEEAIKRGWEMRVMGVPKTIDNDLPRTDHCRLRRGD